jgi:hypothetical protein
MLNISENDVTHFFMRTRKTIVWQLSLGLSLQAFAQEKALGEYFTKYFCQIPRSTGHGCCSMDGGLLGRPVSKYVAKQWCPSFGKFTLILKPQSLVPQF